MKLFSLIFYVLPSALFAAALLATYFRNRFTVEHGQRQRIVIRNIITGHLEVLSQGTWYKPPWWIRDTVVDLNKEPVETGADGHTALTSDGVEVSVRVRWNELTGRPFDPQSGQLTHGSDTIKNENIILAVTRTDFANRQQYMAGVFSAVVDAVIGEFTADELLQPERHHPCVPKQRRVDIYQLDSQKVENRRELLVRLAEYMQREANYRFRDVGYNVDEVQIQDLRPRDPQLQESQDRQQRLKGLQRAAEELRGADLSDRERFSVGTDQQGQVAIADAIRKASENLAEGMKKFGTGG